MAAMKLLSLLLCWGAMIIALARAHRGDRLAVSAGAAAGFIAGLAGEGLLMTSVPGELPFRVVREIGGAGFLLLWGVAVAAIYRSGGGWTLPGMAGRRGKGAAAGVSAALAGAVAGAVSLCRLLPQGADALPLLSVAAVAAAGVALVLAAVAVESRLPAGPEMHGSALAAVLVSGSLFLTCSVPRLDLFSPLSMAIMKFTHDFVHQFFESMLIPDHPFFRPDVWDYIGILFSDKVGFWGGLLLWFFPALLVLLAIRLERLPSVAHIRQGAQRRKQLASFIRKRRLNMLAPLFALLLLTAAAYRSTHAEVQYWDPKPVPVTATPAGEILIPKKGEIDLEDGKLHKFSYRQGGRQARFFLLITPAGRVTVDLDACSICKPDGYGQSGDTVVCYYCKTLIPLDTVGKPGGCNPVPVAFADRGAAVSIDGASLLNTWESTVQQTSGARGGAR